MIFGKKYMVYLPRRGGRRFLFAIKAKDETDAKNKTLEKLEEYADDPSIKESKYLLTIDTKNDVEIKVDNPYYDETLVVKQRTKNPTFEDFMEATVADMVNNYTKAINEAFPKLTSGLVTGVTKTLVEATDSLVKAKLGTQPDPTKPIADVAQIILAIVELAKNKDKVKELLSMLKTEGIDIKEMMGLVRKEGEEKPA